MIINRLSAIMGEKHWTQSYLAKKTGIRPNTINELYHNYAERVNIEHMDAICAALDCDISDIFEYVPGQSKHAATSKENKPQVRVNVVSVSELDAAIESALERCLQKRAKMITTQRQKESTKVAVM